MTICPDPLPFRVPVLVHPAGGWGKRELNALIKAARSKAVRRRKISQEGVWIEYFPGEISLVLAAPHDGICKPSDLPRRSGGVMVRDTGTKGLAASFALEILKRSKARPHLLICHLARTRLDVNRSRDQAAEHPLALEAWDYYHELLAKACECAAAASVRASKFLPLFLDFHAQANRRYSGEDAIELGTIFPTAEDLEKGAEHLNSTASVWLEGARLKALHLGSAKEQFLHDLLVEQMQHHFSMPRLGASVLLRNEPFAEFLRGANSFGELLDGQGIQAVPSLTFPTPPPVLGAMRSAAEEKKAKIASASLKPSHASTIDLAPLRKSALADYTASISVGDVQSTSKKVIDSSAPSVVLVAPESDEKHHGLDKLEHSPPMVTHGPSVLGKKKVDSRDSHLCSAGYPSSTLFNGSSVEGQCAERNLEEGSLDVFAGNSLRSHANLVPCVVGDDSDASSSASEVVLLTANSHHVPAPFFCGSSSVPLTKSCLILDSIQLECPVRMTKNDKTWEPMAGALAESLEQFCSLHKLSSTEGQTKLDC